MKNLQTACTLAWIFQDTHDVRNLINLCIYRPRETRHYLSILWDVSLLTWTQKLLRSRLSITKLCYKLSPLMMKAKGLNGTPLDTLRLRKSGYCLSTEGCVWTEYCSICDMLAGEEGEAAFRFRYSFRQITSFRNPVMNGVKIYGSVGDWYVSTAAFCVTPSAKWLMQRPHEFAGWNEDHRDMTIVNVPRTLKQRKNCEQDGNKSYSWIPLNKQDERHLHLLVLISHLHAERRFVASVVNVILFLWTS